MKRLAAAALVLTLSLFAGQSWAIDRDFDLINATGYPIKHVFIDESASDAWSDDVLGRDMLDDGDTVSIKFGKGDKGCMWDMKVTYSDGENAIWHGFNLCQINSIKLKWNKNTGVTTAVVE